MMFILQRNTALHLFWKFLTGGDDVIKNSFVADKVVGKAAALLMVKAGKRGLCRYYKLSCT